ncbi:MAG: hypothetical protein Faunusvirus4_25 [Faunusvirus sp.]|jgi:hypothetical protein|uniref:Uncharacterized protein n=1 Tax=Faunusvirus sp. TaxID=2487766 RepID=A0A3G4ZXZ3_9VIRU|nr:MAG: hypothetical protein Faunusvirus4_25 [Faunusvirus sp.]
MYSQIVSSQICRNGDDCKFNRYGACRFRHSKNKIAVSKPKTTPNALAPPVITTSLLSLSHSVEVTTADIHLLRLKEKMNYIDYGKTGCFTITETQYTNLVKQEFDELADRKILLDAVIGLIMSYMQQSTTCVLLFCRKTIHTPDIPFYAEVPGWNLSPPIKCNTHIQCTFCGGYCPECGWPGGPGLWVGCNVVICRNTAECTTKCPANHFWRIVNRC